MINIFLQQPHRNVEMDLEGLQADGWQWQGS